MKNRVSDKLSRRDVHYYDLYVLNEPFEDYERMRQDGYPYTQQDAKIQEYYGDLAFQDFNLIFKNHGDGVTKQYGKTITVKLSVTQNLETGGKKVERIVKEDMTLKNIEEEVSSKKKNWKGNSDLTLVNLDM